MRKRLFRLGVSRDLNPAQFALRSYLLDVYDIFSFAAHASLLIRFKDLFLHYSFQV